MEGNGKQQEKEEEVKGSPARCSDIEQQQQVERSTERGPEIRGK